jgi:hypothetical protein
MMQHAAQPMLADNVGTACQCGYTCRFTLHAPSEHRACLATSSVQIEGLPSVLLDLTMMAWLHSTAYACLSLH